MFSVKNPSLFSSDFCFFRNVNDNESVRVVCPYLLSCLSPPWELTAVSQLPCCACNGSTLHTRPECCWEAQGILHLSTHSRTQSFLPQVFGCALLELAPRLVDWMCTQGESLSPNSKVTASHMTRSTKDTSCDKLLCFRAIYLDPVQWGCADMFVNHLLCVHRWTTCYTEDAAEVTLSKQHPPSLTTA